MTHLWRRLITGSINLKLAIVVLALIWLAALGVVGVVLVLMMERAGQAQLPTIESNLSTIVLEPTSGSFDTVITVRGQDWQPGHTVMIYAVAPDDTDVAGYALANAEVDSEGRFAAILMLPPNPALTVEEQIKVIARDPEGGVTVQAFFSLVDSPVVPTETPEEPTPIIPTSTPTTVVQLPTSTAQPIIALATTTADVNIRSGPGTAYAILGLLRTGQNAEVTGLSPDGNWWQINFSGASDDRGWVSASYVTTQNTDNVPLVKPPALPVSPPAPMVISDWRGEYYNNPELRGSPAVVRNDVAINFDWANGAPAAGIAADNFSVRWSRSLSFPAGSYRFYARVDDGVRLWLNDNLVIDRWYDSAPTTYTADVTLTEGTHRLKMEYFECTGTALAQLTWELVESYPDWKGEYFDNPYLSGAPVLVRNDLAVSFGWGPNSPGLGVPADNFSARWTRDLYFSAGTYRFKVLVDDGARLWIDDELIIDRWRTGDPTSYTAEVTLADGIHRVRLEYLEFRYDAQVRLDWERLSSSYPDWKAEYYDNRRLEGNPILVRNETKLDHNWGSGSPAAGISADNFSARWTRKANFEAGTYHFRVKVDDGVRIWFDDTLVLDQWQDGSARTFEIERQVSAGQHRVRVEYYERGGEARISLTWQKRETAVNKLPQALPGGPYTADEGSVVTFDGRASRDPDGTIVKYEWDFDYDGRNFVTRASGPTASAGYQDGPVSITVALRVTDDQGGTHVGTTQVTIQNVAPTVEAGGPYAGQVGNLITFMGTATDPGLVDQTGLAYRWEFGDDSEGSGPVVSHAYARAGTYTVRLTVSDKDGASGSDTATVQVVALPPPPQAPEAVISGPTSGLVGELLNFNGTGSSDSDDGTIISYIWDFGDGTVASGANVSHRYSVAGGYRVSLTVIDNSGLSASATLAVQIDPPVPTNQPPTAVIGGPTNGLVGEELEFSGTDSEDSDGTIVDYRWDFDDGTTATGPNPNASHIFNAAGNYAVTLTVIDNGDLTASATLFVQIDEANGANP